MPSTDNPAMPTIATGHGGTSVMSDQDLAAWLEECVLARHTVGFLYGNDACKIVDLDDSALELIPISPEQGSRKVFAKLARSGRLRGTVQPKAALKAAQVLDPGWTLTPMAVETVTKYIDDRLGWLGLPGGRGAAISDNVAQKVWADAGGCCMFEGCADDLTEIPLYAKARRVGYLAHIVASDPRGPRGCPQRSHLLSNAPDNLMLMCDKHHRLIDVIEPDEFPEDRLIGMRQAHKNLVRRHREALKFPRVTAMTLHANLAGVPTAFREAAFLDALLGVKCAMSGVVERLRRTEMREDRHTPGFWVNYLREHENAIRLLVGEVREAHPEELAVFPLHHIPTLVLAGRILGEARPISVFQYDRQRQSWAWDGAATPKAPGTFQAIYQMPGPADEVLVSIELTAGLDPKALPEPLAGEITEGRLPWVRITLPQPGGDCIAHPDDLEQFARVARQVVNHVQDTMRASKVHLVAMSPASTVFRFGQMLQAGHHSLYVVYDRSNRSLPFVPALSISGQDVSAQYADSSYTIPLR